MNNESFAFVDEGSADGSVHAWENTATPSRRPVAASSSRPPLLPKSIPVGRKNSDDDMSSVFFSEVPAGATYQNSSGNLSQNARSQPSPLPPRVTRPRGGSVNSQSSINFAVKPSPTSDRPISPIPTAGKSGISPAPMPWHTKSRPGSSNFASYNTALGNESFSFQVLDVNSGGSGGNSNRNSPEFINNESIAFQTIDEAPGAGNTRSVSPELRSSKRQPGAGQLSGSGDGQLANDSIAFDVVDSKTFLPAATNNSNSSGGRKNAAAASSSSQPSPAPPRQLGEEESLVFSVAGDMPPMPPRGGALPPSPANNSSTGNPAAGAEISNDSIAFDVVGASPAAVLGSNVKSPTNRSASGFRGRRASVGSDMDSIAFQVADTPKNDKPLANSPPEMLSLAGASPRALPLFGQDGDDARSEARSTVRKTVVSNRLKTTSRNVSPLMPRGRGAETSATSSSPSRQASPTPNQPKTLIPIPTGNKNTIPPGTNLPKKKIVPAHIQAAQKESMERSISRRSSCSSPVAVPRTARGVQSAALAARRDTLSSSDIRVSEHLHNQEESNPYHQKVLEQARSRESSSVVQAQSSVPSHRHERTVTQEYVDPAKLASHLDQSTRSNMPSSAAAQRQQQQAPRKNSLQLGASNGSRPPPLQVPRSMPPATTTSEADHWRAFNERQRDELETLSHLIRCARRQDNTLLLGTPERCDGTLDDSGEPAEAYRRYRSSSEEDVDDYGRWDRCGPGPRARMPPAPASKPMARNSNRMRWDDLNGAGEAVRATTARQRTTSFSPPKHRPQQPIHAKGKTRSPTGARTKDAGGGYADKLQNGRGTNTLPRTSVQERQGKSAEHGMGSSPRRTSPAKPKRAQSREGSPMPAPRSASSLQKPTARPSSLQQRARSPPLPVAASAAEEVANLLGVAWPPHTAGGDLFFVTGSRLTPQQRQRFYETVHVQEVTDKARAKLGAAGAAAASAAGAAAGRAPPARSRKSVRGVSLAASESASSRGVSSPAGSHTSSRARLASRSKVLREVFDTLDLQRKGSLQASTLPSLWHLFEREITVDGVDSDNEGGQLDPTSVGLLHASRQQQETFRKAWRGLELAQATEEHAANSETRDRFRQARRRKLIASFVVNVILPMLYVSRIHSIDFPTLCMLVFAAMNRNNDPRTTTAEGAAWREIVGQYFEALG